MVAMATALVTLVTLCMETRRDRVCPQQPPFGQYAVKAVSCVRRCDTVTDFRISDNQSMEALLDLSRL